MNDDLAKIHALIETCRTTPYKPGAIFPGTGLDCWGFVYRACQAIGIEFPSSAAWALAAAECIAAPLGSAEAAKMGDVVRMRQTPADGDDGAAPGALGEWHVGICLDAFTVAHFGRDGMRVDRLDALKRVDPSLVVLRLLENDRMAAALDEPAQLRTARVVVYDDVLTRTGRRVIEAPLHGRVMPTARGIAGRYVQDPMTAAVLLNGRALAAKTDAAVRAGDELVVAPGVADTGTIVLASIAVLSAIASFVLAPKPKLPAATQSDTPADQRFSFGKVASTAFAGDAIPVVLGERVTTGKIVAQVPGEGIDGAGDNRLKLLICLGHGRCVAGSGSDDGIAAIGNRTAAFDRVASEDLTGIWLNDQPIANFPGCFASGRMGTTDQDPIPGFTDVETAREVGVGGATLRNTSGSPRTGGSASGEAFMFSTLSDVDAVLVRVSLDKGLYSLSAEGQVEPQSVQWRVRTRVTSGPGAWSGWTVVTVTQAQQSQFYSTLRVGGLGGVPCDVQAERVSAETADATVADELRWETCVEIIEATENYPGFAMLALDLTASEQLTGIPNVKIDVKGLGKLRVWDGISDPSEPAFDQDWSDNPADLALEILTNPHWGMGAVYGDGQIDFPSLLAWRTLCAASVSRPGGGTRNRFACDLVLDSAKDGVDWLRTVCRAGRATPVTAGGVWRFIVDDTQSSAVESFTDASIAADADGAAVFEYTRETTTGGRVRPTRTVVQFENGAQDFTADTVAYPAQPGDLWLATEPLVEETVRLDGVTDQDQAATEAKYLMKRARGLSRSVRFTTTKAFVVVQPGDRFDLAISTVGWGSASGRVMEGCTLTSLKLDRAITLAGATTYNARILHQDGSVETVEVSAAAGTYAAGDAVAIDTLAQAPAEFAEYAIGVQGVELKPFTCTRVRLADAEMTRWEIEGIEYDDDVYDDAADEVTLPDYSTLSTIFTPPGPVVDLRAYDRNVGGRRQAELSWRQEPADAQITGSFRVYRRIVGTTTWVFIPDPKIGTRGAIVEIVDTDRAYEFAVVAVSLGGYALSPDDPRVPKRVLVFGLAAPPPGAPTGLIATNTGGNTYELTWDAVDGAVGYQVLFGGDTTTLPNVGAEDCLVLARTVGPALTGLELPPSQACRFWVRSVGPSGRLSFTAAMVNVATPATPAGESIKNTTTCNLSGTGTLTNLAWDSGQSRLELVSALAAGTWVSPTIDTGSETLTELTFRPKTANDAADPTIASDPFTAPSIAADQWGIVSAGPAVVGMVMPPWPDNEHAWTFEVRTKAGGVWSDWAELAPCESLRTTFRQYEVRVTLSRMDAPYRPALRGLVVVTTN